MHTGVGGEANGTWSDQPGDEGRLRAVPQYLKSCVQKIQPESSQKGTDKRQAKRH